MRDRHPRIRRWRRALTGGFVLSLLAHVALLLAFEVTPPRTDATEGADRDRDRASAAREADDLRVVWVRERVSSPAPEAPEPGTAGPETTRPSRPPPLPPSLAGASPGSETAGEALARFASLGGVGETPAVADSSRSPHGARATRQEVPPAAYDGRAEYRATSRAAKEAARSGHLPDLGDGAVAVSDRGRIAGPPDGRSGFSGGFSGGGTCGVPAAINRLWDGRLVLGR